jgi:putative chitinase
MGLTIFDIDDTLFHTTAKIKVISNGQEVRTLTNQEFNNYKLQPDEEFDFGEFRNAEKFAKESEPIKPMINTLKRILDRAANTKVIMLTARADFDDKDKFLATFEKYGIDMSRVHVHRAGNLPGNEPPAYKKAIWVRKYLNTGKYSRVNLIDDSMSNLRVFKSLEKEYPQVDFDAYFVKPSGSIQTVSEGRRRKNKRRGAQSLFSRNTGGVWGAYGPGAYGGYGQDSGYSGGDGGGGESYVKEKIGDVSQFAEPGDTIYSIARQNNISPDEIMRLNGFNKDTKLTVGQEVKLPREVSGTKVDPKPAVVTPSKPVNPVAPSTPVPAASKPGYAGPITSSPLESTLRNVAIQAGLKGQELAQFLAQCAHETGNFASLTEYGGSLDFRKYDPKYAPKKAKELGNNKPGDGALFKGRGFIQLTGRWNYTQAGKALGLPLDKNPKLVERPDIAAKTSLWFWKNRVRPNVDNFADTKTVTYYINTALRGLDERIQFFQKYLSTMRSTKREDINDTTEESTSPGSSLFGGWPINEDQDAVQELHAALLADKQKLQSAGEDQVYSMIDKIMTRIAKSHSITGKALHNMWVNKYKQIPDDWIMNENFADSKVKDNEPSTEFVEAVGNWQEMWNTDEAAKIILNSPESKPFRTPPSTTKLYRAVIPKDRELNSIKANGSVVAFATKLDGAINFVQTLETMDEWIIIEKPFNPSGFLLDYTAMIEHYKLSDFDRYVDEAEVWMKPSPQYSGVKKSEVVLTSQQYYSESVNENFADGKNPQDKGDSARHGIKKGSSITDLKKIRSSDTASARKKQLAHWQINMKQGRKK